MKPEHLEMVGFAPFRRPTVVDFSGIELFALTGPTGAGKSSVIDALTFALYGSAPRHGRNSVEPVVSLGAAEARVRFDFVVEDRLYTAVRVVRRTSRGGATTAEARLEVGGEVLASGAAEVTAAVVELLGLDVGQFTRSVVLPQGEFAAFLHDTPSGQQELVKALLDLGVLDRARALATERMRVEGARVDTARTRLEALADAGEEAEKAAAMALERLEGLGVEVAAAEAEMQSAVEVQRVKSEEAARLADDIELLGTVVEPPGVAVLAAAVTEARHRQETTGAALVVAAVALDEARVLADGLPTAEHLATAADLDAQIAAIRHILAEVDLGALATAVEAARQQLTSAEATRRDAAARLDRVRATHAVHTLVAGAGPGDPCPVCRRPLDSPLAEAPGDVDAAENGLGAAEAATLQANRVLGEAAAAHARGEAIWESESRSLKMLEEQRQRFPTSAELAALGDLRRQADARLAAASSAHIEARGAHTAAESDLSTAVAAQRDAWQAFRVARDRVARIGSPPEAVEDLAVSWRGLREWVEAQVARIEAAHVAAVEAVEIAATRVANTRQSIDVALTEAGVEGEGSPAARLAAAVATAGAALERARERRQEREAVEAELQVASGHTEVAQNLVKHLRANHFEAWLMAEALDTLIDGANRLLVDLSRQAYSLVLENGRIEVVDHRNADEMRSVRSLSGGETFLVSLALALSLGEHLATLSERGGARLDAIFLDEGFGSLDTETLDTVTSVVAELASHGRVVGLVTHVKELAEQVPVRFVVSPGPGGSTIERRGTA